MERQRDKTEANIAGLCWRPSDRHVVTRHVRSGGQPSLLSTLLSTLAEVLQHDAYGEAVDVWGVGCVAMEALTLEFLWERKGMLAAQVPLPPIYVFCIRLCI